MSLAQRTCLDVIGLSAFVVIVAWACTSGLQGQSSGAPGGFMDSATSVGLRPRLSAAEIQTFLPSRGVFRFPSPYSTQGVRLTNSSDCGGADCVLPVGYSYWSNINNHTNSNTMLIFLGLERRFGGGGPTLFSYDKLTGATLNLGPLFASNSALSWSTGEGWYFSATRPTTLYLNSGPRMLRYDVQLRTLATVFDVSAQLGADKYLWQMHSSNDDRVHSATVRLTSTYDMLGCAVHNEATGLTTFFAKKGDFDECQVDRSGRWLVIKENVDGANGEDNRVIDLQTGAEQLLTDPNGAAGHSDIGFGYMLAEDNYHMDPGAVRLWNLALDMRGGQPATVQGQGDLVYRLSSWVSGLGHITYGNAHATVPIDQQRACVSNASRQDLPRVNEIVCFPLDGSLNALIVAPNLTDLNAAGGGPDDYSKLPKGNIDVTGEYFIWTANAGTSRLDAFLVRIPGGSTAPAPAPTPSPAPAPPPPAPAPAPVPSLSTAVTWTSLVNVTASTNSLRKTSGCDGCPDAGAVSAQRIKSGDGHVSFSTTDTQRLRFIGLSTGNAGTSPTEIRFALRLHRGVAEVREAGVYKADVAFASGDVFRIAVVGGAVTYAKNGSVFFTSQTAVAYPLLVDTALLDLNGTLSSVMISGSAASQDLSR
ncbi:MAG TPA: hypothetical protein VFO58_08495 [Vicinamibacterales bacterium]|nr:hypothetical protein [Vicinamibacterales bacterium]